MSNFSLGWRLCRRDFLVAGSELRMSSLQIDYVPDAVAPKRRVSAVSWHTREKDRERESSCQDPCDILL